MQVKRLLVYELPRPHKHKNPTFWFSENPAIMSCSGIREANTVQGLSDLGVVQAAFMCGNFSSSRSTVDSWLKDTSATPCSGRDMGGGQKDHTNTRMLRMMMFASITLLSGLRTWMEDPCVFVVFPLGLQT